MHIFKIYAKELFNVILNKKRRFFKIDKFNIANPNCTKKTQLFLNVYRYKSKSYLWCTLIHNLCSTLQRRGRCCHIGTGCPCSTPHHIVLCSSLQEIVQTGQTVRNKFRNQILFVYCSCDPCMRLPEIDW